MRLFSLFAIALVSASGLFAQDKPVSKATKPKAAPAAATEEPAEGVTGLESIGKLIQEGVRSVKVRNPGFDQGRRTSFVEADALTRLEGNRLFGEGVTIQLYGAEPKDTIRVDLPTATYFMDTKQLVSDKRSRVRRDDFQIEGDSMTFDTTTSRGQMKGHVHMVIFDLSQLSSPTPEKPAVPVPADQQAAPQPAPAGTTPKPPAK
jgi:hypothetical protein